MGALFFLGPPSRLRPGLADVCGLACFTLALWAKEPNFIVGAPLLMVMAADHASRRGAPWKRIGWALALLAVWLHAALKAWVMNGAGYGRAPLSGASVEAMLRELPRQVLLSASGWCVPLALIAGVALYVALGYVAPASEYEYRLGVYFNEHLPFFAGRSERVAVRRRTGDVPAGAYLVARRSVEGFELVLRVDPPALPRTLGFAESVSRAAHLGAALPPVVLDAGVEPPVTWLVSRKSE